MKAAALLALAADLLDKALQPTDLLHGRSPAYVVLACALAAALAVLVPRVPSRALGAAAGLAIGGALANAISAVAWAGVPDPLVAGGFAFNLADLFALGGVGAMVVVAPFVARQDRRG